ncbi:MAG: hypothetical protein ABI402_01160 [Ferruginibacter sp.]
MLQENLNEEINPRSIEDAGTSSDSVKPKEEELDDEESYDILPSNSAGLEGNDSQQVIDVDEEEDDE